MTRAGATRHMLQAGLHLLEFGIMAAQAFTGNSPQTPRRTKALEAYGAACTTSFWYEPGCLRKNWGVRHSLQLPRSFNA